MKSFKLKRTPIIIVLTSSGIAPYHLQHTRLLRPYYAGAITLHVVG